MLFSIIFSAILLPAIHATILCLDPEIQHLTPPLVHPSYTDCQQVADNIYDEDTRRPPQASTFGERGDVDFIVPKIFRYQSCRAVISMRADKRDQVGRTSITEFALHVMSVVDECREEKPPGFGGGTDVAGNMQLTVWGVTDLSGGESGNVSIGWEAAVDGLRNGTRSRYGVLTSHFNVSDAALRPQGGTV